MKLDDTIALFEGISRSSASRNRRAGVTTLDDKPIYEYDYKEAVQWITDAESALKSVFPPGHAIVRRWEAIFAANGIGNSMYMWTSDEVFDAAHAVFGVALSHLKSGRVAGIIDGIKAETTGELLDQAETLVASNYLAAAMVIAGGALESFLRYLCERQALSWKGAGSITNYEHALAQARNAGKETISPTDGKLVTSWGGMRNDAAHNPGQFNRSSAEIRTVIMQIRDFVARHS